MPKYLCKENPSKPRNTTNFGDLKIKKPTVYHYGKQEMILIIMDGWALGKIKHRMQYKMQTHHL